MMQEKHGFIRSIDIACQLGVTKPSVSYATKRLRENGYIEVDGDGYITLNPPGLTIAQRIATRHRLLTRFLMALGVSEQTASADACKMEHDLSDETFEKILQHAQRYGAVEEQPR